MIRLTIDSPRDGIGVLCTVGTELSIVLCNSERFSHCSKSLPLPIVGSYLEGDQSERYETQGGAPLHVTYSSVH